MREYWKTETPVVVKTAKNVLQYYPKVRKLAVSRPRWTDDDGQQCQGKTVTLDIESLLVEENRDAARKLFGEILALLNEG